MSISKSLILLRNKKGWNQSVLADKLGISQRTVSAIERTGKTSTKTEMKILEILEAYGIVHEWSEEAKFAKRKPDKTANNIEITPPQTDREKLLYLKAQLEHAIRDYDKLVDSGFARIENILTEVKESCNLIKEKIPASDPDVEKVHVEDRRGRLR